MQFKRFQLVQGFGWWRAVRAFLITTSILNVALLVEFFIPNKVSFDKIETEKNITWVSSETIPIGNYFITVGRVQGACSLSFGGRELSDNLGAPGLSERSSLFLGSPLLVKAEPAKIMLSCEKQIGSPVRLVHSIYLNTYRKGSFVHLVRVLTDLALPLTIATFFIVFIILSNRARHHPVFGSGFLTGLITFLYLVSLENFPRLFLSNIDALFLHCVLKLGFVISILSWLSVGMIRKAIFARIFLVISFVFFFTFFENRNYLFKVYMVFYHLIPFGVLSIFFLLKSKKDALSVRQNLFRFFPIFLTSVFDIYFHHVGGGAFLAPVSTLAIFGLATGDYIRNARASDTARKLMAKVSSLSLESGGSIAKLSKISEGLANATQLEKWTIYLDSYFIGKCPRPSQELGRISSSVAHTHPEDYSINLEGPSNFGAAMRQAILEKKPILERSKSDGCLFMIVPIVGIGCLNFSSIDRHQGDWERINIIIEEIFNELSAVVTTIVRSELASNLSVSAIREELGTGTHDVSYGVIFADAVGYTQNVQRSEKFVAFFQFEYIPALLRHLGRNVTLKDLFGDELFLIVKDFGNRSDLTVNLETANAIQDLQEFIRGYGANICTASGFDPITFKVGAHAGSGQIIVAGTDLSLSGPVIEAKRCQGRSRPEEPFISKSLFECLSLEQRTEATLEVYAAKKEILTGYRLKRQIG